MKYFEASVLFDDPATAMEAARVLIIEGYDFERTVGVRNEADGVVLTPTVYGFVSGWTYVDIDDLKDKLDQIINPFDGFIVEWGFEDRPSTSDERYARWTRGPESIH
jgi:hypothetical protein